jgi:hypothetical protein
MGKDWSLRLTQTVTQIEAAPLPGFVGDKELIVQSLRAWLVTASAADKERLSDLMSQNKTANRPKSEADRALRRAMILLRCVLTKPDPGGWPAQADAANEGSGGLDLLFARSMLDAHDAIYSGQAKGEEGKGRFFTHTREFLERFAIRTSGKPDSKIYTFAFFMKDNRYMITPFPQNPPAIVNLKAINLPATGYTSVKDNVGHLPGTDSRAFNAEPLGKNVMLTTQFTGCCYCFMLSNDRSSLVAAHIDPEKKIDGDKMADVIRPGGGFANGNGGVFRAYGRQRDPAKFGYPIDAQQMIVVAVCRDNKWEIWSQITENNGSRTVERIDNSTKGI